jgi:diaminohydroxyphosphoribosylaminopyrimidine deaminase/5-amino-6-(5-phosphoribosylamino)uracil reductase
MTPDEKLMSLALTEARKGWGRTSPNPMVGAVVAKDGQVISKGYHHRAGEPHAEVMAITAAKGQTVGSTLYVTLEPCNHQGRTPPCTAAILKAGLKRVVIGARDPNPSVAGNGASYLAARGLSVTTGVLEGHCLDLIEFFRKYITTALPFVILKSAATLDGKLATVTGDSRWITGEKARRVVHRLRNGVDAILVGRGTVEIDNPSLNTRLPGRARGRDPIRLVLDTYLRSPLDSKVFDPATGGPTIAVCGPEPPAKAVAALEKKGVRIWSLPLVKGRVSLGGLLQRLGGEGLTSLLIEGGATVNYAALVEERIVDKALFFYAPKIVGGTSAPTLVGGSGIRAMSEALNMDIVKFRHLGPDLLMEAKPRY